MGGLGFPELIVLLLVLTPFIILIIVRYTYKAKQIPEEDKEEDKLNTGLQVLSVLFPIAGFIIYILYKDNYPNRAKTAARLAAIGFGLAILLSIMM